ncbi:hypothetical protein [Nocardia niwae]|uniref:hypothetical protein n=1 Tax=Nocardia niwae TaxID=626084 RepID=UPI0033D54626
MSAIIHNRHTGDLVPDHENHFQPWHDGFRNGYRRSNQPGTSDDDRRAAAISSGLERMRTAGCAECAEYLELQFTRVSAEYLGDVKRFARYDYRDAMAHQASPNLDCTGIPHGFSVTALRRVEPPIAEVVAAIDISDDHGKHCVGQSNSGSSSRSGLTR